MDADKQTEPFDVESEYTWDRVNVGYHSMTIGAVSFGAVPSLTQFPDTNNSTLLLAFHLCMGNVLAARVMETIESSA